MSDQVFGEFTETNNTEVPTQIEQIGEHIANTTDVLLLKGKGYLVTGKSTFKETRMLDDKEMEIVSFYVTAIGPEDNVIQMNCIYYQIPAEGIYYPVFEPGTGEPKSEVEDFVIQMYNTVERPIGFSFQDQRKGLGEVPKILVDHNLFVPNVSSNTEV